ncbi:MAG TPA: hypothetical protein PKO21_12855 [Verrucomicrobiota bacterium]|nr:hypothetical protein [Verrucomicrobiota bacterium]
MPEKSRLTRLAEQRQLLLLEAELHRNLITLEAEKWRTALSELSATRTRVTHSPWMLAGGAVAGLVTWRYWRNLKRWAPAALSAWRWVRSMTRR